MTFWIANHTLERIEDVDLYGGTKHSTAMGLREVATFEEARKMTGHTTNKAFDRYLQLEGEKMKELYARRESVMIRSAKTHKNEYIQQFSGRDDWI